MMYDIRYYHMNFDILYIGNNDEKKILDRHDEKKIIPGFIAPSPITSLQVRNDC